MKTLLRKGRERKRRRRPDEWTFEELSNPDHEWLEFLRDIRLVLGREPQGRERPNVGKYLRLNTTCYKNKPEPLKAYQRKKMREMICEEMKAGGKVPDGRTLIRIYKFCKGKTKKELWK